MSSRDIPSIMASWIKPGPSSAYDRLVLSPGEYSRLQMFVGPVGAMDPYTNRVKTWVETNMVISSALPPPASIVIQRIVFTFGRSTEQRDVYSLAEGVFWNLRIDDKQHFRSPLISLQTVKNVTAPLRICEFCRSVYVQQERCPGCGASQFKLSSLGEVQTGISFVMEMGSFPTYIPSLQRFRVDLAGSFTLAGRTDLWCHLEGLGDLGIS